MNRGSNKHIENNPAYMKAQAREALKAAKMLEAQQLAAGGNYVHIGIRSRVLKKI